MLHIIPMLPSLQVCRIPNYPATPHTGMLTPHALAGHWHRSNKSAVAWHCLAQHIISECQSLSSGIQDLVVCLAT
jgi:hypothetical protein